MDPEKLAKLQKMQSAVRIGGKGTPRRKVKRVPKNEGDDRKLQATLQKLNVQTLPGMEEVSLFKEDGKVITVSRPQVQAAANANTFAISGRSVEKDASELLPDLLKNLGPEALAQLQKLSEMSGMGAPAAAASAGEAGDDEIPELVESFEPGQVETVD